MAVSTIASARCAHQQMSSCACMQLKAVTRATTLLSSFPGIAACMPPQQHAFGIVWAFGEDRTSTRAFCRWAGMSPVQASKMGSRLAAR